MGVAAKFYETAFAADRVAEHPDGRIDIRLGGQKVFISPANGSMSDTNGVAEASLDHIALVVKDLMALVSDLQAMNVVFIQDVKNPKPGVWTAFILAPDNVKIELIQRD